MSCKPKMRDGNNAGGDLESALRGIRGVADTLYSMEEAHETSLGYLSDRLHEHHAAPLDAFRRIYRLDQYRDAEGSGDAAYPPSIAARMVPGCPSR